MNSSSILQQPHVSVRSAARIHVILYIFCLSGPSCGHIIHHNQYKYCSCDGCIRKKNKLIKDYIYKNRDCPKKTFGDLNAKLSFILSALLSYGTNSDGLVIYADKLHDNFNLFPNKNITNKAMKYLIDNYFLVLAENNPDQNFQFIENNKIDLIRYNPNYYELWLENDVKESLNHYKYGESKKALWHRINKAETLNYILTIFEKYYIKYYDIYELRQIMEKFVDSFSLLQILNVINFVTRKPAQDIALHNLSRKDAGYQITRHLKNYYYYAIKNNLEIKENGITNYNFSIITKFFYYHILGVDEIGKSKIF